MSWSLIAVFGAAALSLIAAGPFLAAAAWTAAAGARRSSTRERIFVIALLIGPAVVLLAPAAGPLVAAALATPAPAFAADAAVSATAPTAAAGIDWRALARAAGGFAFAAMAAGAAVQAVSILVRDRRARRLAAGAETDVRLHARAAAAARKLGVAARPDVRVTAEDVSPFLAPAARPTVVVPRAMADHLAPDALAAVIAHELAHYVRGDRIAGVAASLTAAAFWFVPGVGRIAAWLDDAREAECDRLALDFAPTARRAYAHALLTAHAADSAAGRAVAVSFIPRKHRSSYMRIRSILTPAQARPRRLLIGAAALAAFGLPAFAGSAALAAALGDDDTKKPVTIIWTDKDGETHELKTDGDNAFREKTEDGEDGVRVFETEDGENVFVLIEDADGDLEFFDDDIGKQITVDRRGGSDGGHVVVVRGDDGEVGEFILSDRDGARWVNDEDGDGSVVIRRMDEDGNILSEDDVGGGEHKNVIVKKIEGDDGGSIDIIIKRDGDADEDDD